MKASSAPLPSRPQPLHEVVDFSAITPELIAKYDRPGPRYTSYPTAPQFTPQFQEADYREALRRAAKKTAEPLSLYVHIPFCEARCTYCGCNVVISPRRGPEEAYLEAVECELQLVAQLLGSRRQLAQMHWGGGTPTYLTPTQCERLFSAITKHFVLLPNAEIAVEVDPCVTSLDHLKVLRELGFNRLSMGLQDLQPQVQQAVRRVQSLELTKSQVEAARRLGFTSVNLDLMYGLPYQTPESFAHTADTVVRQLSPDRLAVFSYAHVPWIKPHQKALEVMPLPKGYGKFAIFAAAAQVFLAAGYRFIGMDHFAKPEDELSRALDSGTLHRNFMGYTVFPASDLIGVGLTSIGDVGGAYVQNEKNLARYQRTVKGGNLAVERGLWRTPEDELRGAVIRRLICTFALPFSWVRERFGVDPKSYFARELAELQPFLEDGLLTVDDQGITVQPQGRFFIRNICMPFDTYLRGEKGKVIYSRTV
ncbi:MAG: oxygen-independent coproporphyrinogen III oxidase [Thermoanaerobaculum sp.]|nr:oxygen-independent coproporphyrinogen III oxidase [Thermoanaerobaculum sp.]MDW7968343.1 oxygen-independent coproporphyrinogen III oxidase [Thermoanaerobaculum sp.]